MCAILGVISKNEYQQFATQELWDMCKMQEHRGPNDKGGMFFDLETRKCNPVDQEEWVKGKGWFGFQRLSIQDLSINGHQPMLSDNHDIAIVFNGEIYNFKELRKELEQKGCAFKSGTDTEVLLNSYIVYGLEKTLSLINGMYGFAILDLRINELFVVRDRFGIKPLYIANTEDALLFSSELKSFLKYHSFEAKLNREGFEELLLFKENIGNTMFQGVEEVEPGTIVSIDLETMSHHKEKYFDIESYHRGETDCNINDLADEAESILKKVVKRQLISDTKVGCQLSGGIDSSLITKICAEDYGIKDAISCITDTNYQTDAPYIRRVVNDLNLNSYTIDMNSEIFIDKLVDIIWHFERPLSHTPATGMFQISKCSEENGITVLLSGEGADEMFGGYKEFLETALPDRELSEKDLIDAIVFREGKDEFNDLESIFPGVRAERFYEERITRLKHFTGSPFDKHLKYETSVQLVELLNRQDRMSMTHSIENRVPFLDNEMVDFAWRLPKAALMDTDKRSGKYVLKELTTRYFDYDFSYRKKVGFFIPGNRYLCENASFMNNILSRIEKRGIIQADLIKEWAKKDALQTGGLNHFQSAVFLKAITFEIWCELFLDGKTVEDCKSMCQIP